MRYGNERERNERAVCGERRGDGGVGEEKDLVKLCIARRLCTGCPRYNGLVPAKGHRGIKEYSSAMSNRKRLFRVIRENGRGALPLSFHARHVALSFCSNGSRYDTARRCSAARIAVYESFRVWNHCSSLQQQQQQLRRTTVHVPSVSRLYVACVLRQPAEGIRRSRVSRLRDVETLPLRPGITVGP